MILPLIEKLLDDQEQRHSDMKHPLANLTERSRLWDHAHEALTRRDYNAFDQTMKQFWKLGEAK